MLKKGIVEAIRKLAKRKIMEHEQYHNLVHLEYMRERKRVKNPMPKKIMRPEHWELDKKHNPYYVLKNCEKIGQAIFKKLVESTYKPLSPHIKSVPKKGGGNRNVYIYQIPDEAVSNYFYHSLLSKNKHRFSSFSYAYRNDRNVHYAIKDISLDLRTSSRTFVAEFDFKDFFGSITHEYLIKQFNQNGFLISKMEKQVITTFLEDMSEDKGIPQGTSLSLFLANIACWKLDKELEKEGLRFARYADDTIIWTDDYSKINKSFESIDRFCFETGVKINLSKSDGISLLLDKDMQSELASNKHFIDFLGYSLSTESISIKDSSVAKIKSKISFILYQNLIQPLNGSSLQSLTIPSNDEDKDFVTAVMQIRRYLYGNLDERSLKNYINGSFERLRFKGIMSFYPLIDDEKQLKELDEWLLSTIMNTLKKRSKLLNHWNQDRSNQFPFNMAGNELLKECKIRLISRKKGLMEIPSFLRIYQAMKLNILNVGIENAMNPRSNEYNYF